MNIWLLAIFTFIATGDITAFFPCLDFFYLAHQTVYICCSSSYIKSVYWHVFLVLLIPFQQTRLVGGQSTGSRPVVTGWRKPSYGVKDNGDDGGLLSTFPLSLWSDRSPLLFCLEHLYICVIKRNIYLANPSKIGIITCVYSFFNCERYINLRCIFCTVVKINIRLWIGHFSFILLVSCKETYRVKSFVGKAKSNA